MSDKFEQWFESELDGATKLKDFDWIHTAVLNKHRYLSGWNAALSSLQGEQAAKIAEQDARIKELEHQLVSTDQLSVHDIRIGMSALLQCEVSEIEAMDNRCYDESYQAVQRVIEAISLSVKQEKLFGNEIYQAAANHFEQKIKELEQQLEVARKDEEWKPIQTAPKDGTLLMVYSRTHGYVSAWWGQVDGGGHPENGPPVYWWVSDHCEFIDGPYDAPLMWKPLNELSDTVIAAILQIGGAE